jgi:hypothetical protein
MSLTCPFGAALQRDVSRIFCTLVSGRFCTFNSPSARGSRRGNGRPLPQSLSSGQAPWWGAGPISNLFVSHRLGPSDHLFLPISPKLRQVVLPNCAGDVMMKLFQPQIMRDECSGVQH